jgi:methylthioribulose-1-phosphate dehydratase
MSSARSAVPTSRLIELGRRFHTRGWVLGTSGNFSVVVSREPFRLAITASSVHKGALGTSDILMCDEHGAAIGRRSARPSAETLLHVQIAKCRGADAVLHTHSVWATLLSDRYGDQEGLSIDRYEMLKGLTGVSSHEHREWIPIVENDQDMPRLATRMGEVLRQFPQTHAVLLRRHGLYTWGATLTEAERHVEILEFLFEVIGRQSNGHRENS